jgi:hypothetical protein
MVQGVGQRGLFLQKPALPGLFRDLTVIRQEKFLFPDPPVKEP